MSTAPAINVDAVTQVMKGVLPKLRALRKQDSPNQDAIDELISENEKLGDAFYRSEYARSHIGWGHALQLIYAVLNAGYLNDAREFATQLDAAVRRTAAQRDYIAVIPLGFFRPLGFSSKKPNFVRSFEIGSFTVAAAAASSAALNSRIKAFGSHEVSDELFEHQAFQSHKALSSHPLLFLPVHGSSDSLRYQLHAKAHRMIGLIELFGRVFGADKSLLGQEATSHHLFLIHKHSGSLDRVMAMRPLTVSLPLGKELLKAMKRPEVPVALELLSSGKERTLNAQLRNALEFFGRAVNEKDSVARFIFFVISMEAVFSRDKNAPIKMTLADNASLLCFKGKDRRRVHADLGEIYDTRSEIVHTGASSVQRAMLIKAEVLAARALYCSLLLAIHLDDGKGNLQKKFFDLLKGMKIGVELNPIRLPAWQGYGLEPEEQVQRRTLGG